jgi:hypothetical protein
LDLYATTEIAMNKISAMQLSDLQLVHCHPLQETPTFTAPFLSVFSINSLTSAAGVLVQIDADIAGIDESHPTRS